MVMTVFGWLRGAAPMHVGETSAALDRAAMRAEDCDVQIAIEPAVDGEQASSRFVMVRSQIERFSATLTDDLAKFAALHAKAEADYAQLQQRHATLASSYAHAKEALTASESQAAVLSGEQLRLRKDVSVLAGKLDAAKTDVQSCQDKLAQLRDRFSALETEHAALSAESDRRGVSLAKVRQELVERSQHVEMARMQVEQGRRRESECVQRANALEAENVALQSELAESQRQSAQDKDRIGRLVAVLDSARIELDARSHQIAELQEAKEAVASERDRLTAQMEDALRGARERIQALTETKDELLAMCETQRLQIEEQLASVAQLEMANARLGRELVVAGRPATPSDRRPCEAGPASGARPRTRRRPARGSSGQTLIMPDGPFHAQDVMAEATGA